MKQQGKFVVAQKRELSAFKWKDKQVVNFLSTADNPLDATQVDRKQKNGEVLKVPCPSVVPKYNNHMNGVDHADQLRTQYSTYRSSRKWWQYLF